MTDIDNNDTTIRYAHENAVDFSLSAKCSKEFGLWAANQLGLEEQNAEIYAETVVEADLEEKGFDDILRKVQADFEEKGIDISLHEMKVQLDKALQKAKQNLI